MTSNQMMDYYVRLRCLYLHSRTCTRSRLCRRPSRLVAFHICYLLDRASVHEISALVTWFQYMSNISIHYGDHGPMYIFIMEILIYVYCMWLWPHMWYNVSCIFMAIVLLSIKDCYIYLYLCAEFDHYIVLLDSWFFHLVLHHSTSGMDLNVFQPSYDPSDLTH